MVKTRMLGLHRILPRVGPPDESSHLTLVDDLLAITFVLGDGVTDGRVLKREELLQTGLSLAALLEVATDNLARIADLEMDGPNALPSGLVGVLAEDGRAVDRVLLLDQLFDRAPVGGWFVCMPSPDRLMAVPLEEVEDIEAIQVMLGVVGLLGEQLDHAIDPTVFWVHEGEWEAVRIATTPTGQLALDPSWRLVQVLDQLVQVGWVSAAAEA